MLSQPFVSLWVHGLPSCHIVLYWTVLMLLCFLRGTWPACCCHSGDLENSWTQNYPSSISYVLIKRRCVAIWMVRCLILLLMDWFLFCVCRSILAGLQPCQWSKEITVQNGRRGTERHSHLQLASESLDVSLINPHFLFLSLTPCATMDYQLFFSTFSLILNCFLMPNYSLMGHKQGGDFQREWWFLSLK